MSKHVYKETVICVKGIKTKYMGEIDICKKGHKYILHYINNHPAFVRGYVDVDYDTYKNNFEIIGGEENGNT